MKRIRVKISGFYSLTGRIDAVESVLHTGTEAEKRYAACRIIIF
jgi:hypothetical protein